MKHLFNRFELKYILSLEQAHAIQEALKDYTDFDPHGGETGYRISSLYYDSPELDFFWDKIEGLKYRRKLRLRVYPSEKDEPITTGMVEIKQRINRTVQKRRIQLPLADAFALCAGELDISDFTAWEKMVASEVFYLVQAKALKPTCIIDYHRKALVGRKYNPDLRITFDTDLRASLQNLDFPGHVNARRFLPPDCCIMEIKVDETVPDWVGGLLMHFNLELHRVSKYCTGVAHDSHQHLLPLVLSPLSPLTTFSEESLCEQQYH